MMKILLQHTVLEAAMDILFNTLEQNFTPVPAEIHLESLMRDLATYEHVYVTPDEYKLLEDALVSFETLWFEGEEAIITCP